MSDDTLRKIKALARDILILCEDVSEFRAKEPKAEISSKKEATLFEAITLEDTEFDIQLVDITTIYPEKSGETFGKAWAKQSIKIRDCNGDEREIIAWNTAINVFRSIRVGDRVNITDLKNVKQYTRKDGTIVTQYTVGDNTKIHIDTYEEGHIL